jgi:putative sigma-54 modulation protein
MKINIQELSFQASDTLIDFTEDKVKNLYQYNDEITEANVILKVDRSGTKQDRFCQIRLTIPGNDIIASKQCQSFEESILKTCEAIKKQLNGKNRFRKVFIKRHDRAFQRT